MKIRSSPWKRVAHVEPDPEVEFEKRQAEHQANIARLEAHKAELHRKIAVLERKIMGKDWLCYMPTSAGSPEVISRACSYLKEMQGRVEAEGGRMWLCKDHDCATRLFEITEFRALEGALFCSGDWTAEGRKHRNTYQGLSMDNITFSGNIGLQVEIKHPANQMSMADMPPEVQAADNSDSVLGLIGAVCIVRQPAHGVTPIYHLVKNKATNREELICTN